jgi:hypothetical protein
MRIASGSGGNAWSERPGFARRARVPKPVNSGLPSTAAVVCPIRIPGEAPGPPSRTCGSWSRRWPRCERRWSDDEVTPDARPERHGNSGTATKVVHNNRARRLITMSESVHVNRIAEFLETPTPSTPAPATRSPSAKGVSPGEVGKKTPVAERSADAYRPYLSPCPFADKPDSPAWLAETTAFARDVRQASVNLRHRRCADYPSDQAGWLAALVDDYVASVELWLVPTEDDIPECDQSEFEREEWREHRELWSRLRPQRKALQDTARVKAVLIGQTVARPAESKALCLVLEEYARRAGSWLAHYAWYQEELRHRRPFRWGFGPWP